MKKLLLLLLLVPQLVFGANYYADCSQSDGGDGSEGDPYDTAQLALDDASGGDTVWIAGTCTLSSEINWTGFGGGTSLAAKLTIRGWDNGQAANVTPAAGDRTSPSIVGAVLDGQDSVAVPFSHTNDPNYVNYLNIKFIRFTGPWQPNYYLTVVNCEFTDWNSSNYMWYGSNIVTHINNYWHDNDNGAYLAIFSGDVFMYGCVYETDGIISPIGAVSVYANNIFKSTSTPIIYNQQNLNKFVNNTFIGDPAKSDQVFIQNGSANIHPDTLINNIFMDIDTFATANGGADTSLGIVGWNALYNTSYNGTNNEIFVDLTEYDVTESTYPIDSNYDLVAGTNSENAALSVGELDIGGSESSSGGGGAGAGASCLIGG